MADKPGFSRIGTASAEEENMAQIREILFGEQQRQTAQQLARLEARLGEQERNLRGLLEERIAAVSGAVDALRGELEAQGERQQAALDGVQGALQLLLDKLDQRLTLLDSDLQDGHHRLEQSIADQATALERLRQGGVGRAQLANLLDALAGQLRDSPPK